MSRILLAWELGRNLGHLARLLPLAKRLKARGHSTLVAAQNMASAARILGPEGIAFVQSPLHTAVRKSDFQSTSYADLLWLQGWDDRAELWGRLQAWVNLYRMFQPETVVLDYSPTACLAARIMKIPRVLIGTGFELPPALDPLPPFPGYLGATRELAVAAEQRVLDNVNAVLSACAAEPLNALKAVVDGDRRLLTTFAELDHYGPRAGERYIGPLSNPADGRKVAWPSGTKKRVFAYLRPEMGDLAAILDGLVEADVSLIAYAPGVPNSIVDRFRNADRVFTSEPVQYEQLFASTDLCVSYGSAGTVTTALLNGVPQLVRPIHRESQLTAHCVERLGVGSMLPKVFDSAEFVASVNRLLNGIEYTLRARQFAHRYRLVNAAEAAEEVVKIIEELANQGRSSSIMHAGRSKTDSTLKVSQAGGRVGMESGRAVPSGSVAGSSTELVAPSRSPRVFVQIEIGTRCNYECFYCVGRDMAQTYMAWDLFVAILGRQSAPEVERVSLQGEGEPMMHPRFWDMTAAILAKGLVPYTITNGSLLEPERVAGAFPAIGISIDTVDPEYAQKIGRYKLQRVLRNLDALLSVMSPDRIIIHTVAMGQELGPLRRYLAQRGIKQHMIQPLQPKADYAHRYSEEDASSWGTCTYRCRFLAAPVMRYYDITGLELPCCFIKNAADFISRDELQRQLNQRNVPACCRGCSAIFPDARVAVSRSSNVATS
jgi:UDP:flavonoid glycosyltransferase YjiC (YdhE family)